MLTGADIRFRATPRDRRRLAALMRHHERTASDVLRLLLARAYKRLTHRKDSPRQSAGA